MKIVEIYSHLNSIEYLLVHKPDIYKELIDVIYAIDAESCRTKISEEHNIIEKLHYNATDMNRQFGKLLREKSWYEGHVDYWITREEKLIRETLDLSPSEQKYRIDKTNETPIPSYNQIGFMKDRVALEVQFKGHSSVAYDLNVKHLAFYIGDLIDVGIEIMPMKALQVQMSSGVPYYEGEFYNVIRQGRGVPAVPLILIGIEP